MPDSAAFRRVLIDRVLSGVEDWEARWGTTMSTHLPEDVETLLDEYAARMSVNLPFYHPRYAGQMLKAPHPVAVAGYLAAMIINPNNHALDASQATSPMEFEVVRMLADMFGLPNQALGHLTSSGTIANLEALWVARELRPDTAVVYSEGAHYTHGRMCQVLGVRSRAVPANPDGRIDLDAAEAACRRGDVGTLVLTPGTTGLGAVDDIHEAITLRERYGVRLHVDAAYGGFFVLLGGPAFEAIALCDSVVVDPHKHGLQPYGCGAVLFADPSVARLYRHDSPYTYFTSDEPHLGEISLECSRAGAAAGALWLTLRALPLRRDRGLGPILDACRRAARSFAARVDASETMTLHLEPALDIVTYFPSLTSMRAVDSVSDALLHSGMKDEEDPIFLSSLRVGAGAFAALHPGVDRDAQSARVLRSVLMKPEHEHNVAWLAERVETLADGVTLRPGDRPEAGSMKPVLIRQHEEMTPPGLLVEWLEEGGIPYKVQHSYKGEALPDPSDYAFVASLGSPYGPNDTHEPSVVDELGLIGDAVEKDVPVLGLCFGGEVLSAVLGGTVERAPKAELGWREIQTDDPDAISAGPWLEWHYERFTTPPGAVEVARTADAVQAFRIGPHLGVQFHPESTVEIVAHWAGMDTENLAELGIEDGRALLDVAPETEEAAREGAFRLFDAFLEGLRESGKVAGRAGGKE